MRAVHSRRRAADLAKFKFRLPEARWRRRAFSLRADLPGASLVASPRNEDPQQRCHGGGNWLIAEWRNQHLALEPRLILRANLSPKPHGLGIVADQVKAIPPALCDLRREQLSKCAALEFAEHLTRVCRLKRYPVESANGITIHNADVGQIGAHT